MAIRIRRPEITPPSEFCVEIWIDRTPPADRAAFPRERRFQDLAPSERLISAMMAGRWSDDAFISAYELELDLVPAARLAPLVRRASRRELTLVSQLPIAAYTLRRYLNDLVALSDAREDELVAMYEQSASVARRAYETRRAGGAGHGTALCASKRAVRALPRTVN